MKITVARYNSWHTEAGIQGTVTDRRRKRWKVVELKESSAVGDRASCKFTHILGLEIKTLYYTVKYSKAHRLQRTQAHDNVRQTRELTYVTRHANTCSRL